MTFFKSINDNNYGKDKETEREREDGVPGDDMERGGGPDHGENTQNAYRGTE